MLTDKSRITSAADRRTHQTDFRSPWCRRLALATAGVLSVSTLFPIAAGLSKDTSSLPAWWGLADVGVAALLAALALAVVVFGDSHIDARAEQASYRAYRILIHALLALTTIYIFAGDRIVWSQGLPGIAWRAWLLMYALPAWISLQSASGIPAGRLSKRS